jgi:hypothetical protein
LRNKHNAEQEPDKRFSKREPKHRNQHSSIPIADYMLRDYGSDHNRRILNNNNNRCREIRKKNTKGLSVEETRLTGEAQGA